MRKTFGLIIVFTFLFAFSAFAQELGLKAIGVRGGVGFGSTFGIVGFHADLGELTENLRFQPDVQVIIDGGTNVTIDFNVNYLFEETKSGIRPFVGGGVGVLTGEDNTDILINLLAGIEKEMSSKYKVFGEVRGILDGGNAVEFIGGIAFPIE